MKKTLLITIFFAILCTLYAQSAYAAVGVGSWTANSGTSLSIYSTDSAEFSYSITAVSSYGGKYSLYLYREGMSTPLKTYAYNVATIGDEAHGTLTIIPQDYQSVPGNYYVLIYSVDDFGANSFKLFLTVTQCIMPMSVTCTATPTSGYNPLNVNFNANLQGGSGQCLLYEWTFADGIIQNTNVNHISHTYPNVGQFYPSVKVTDGLGHYADASCGMINVIEHVNPITGTCSVSPKSGTAPLNTHFTGTASGGSGGYSYEWSYGDGGSDYTSSGSIDHVYDNSGTFSAKLTIHDDGGRSVVVNCGQVSVTQLPALTATCNANPRTGNEPLNVHFTGSASGGAGGYTYSWDFSDGFNDFTINPYVDHIYNAGSFYPTLTVNDKSGKSVTVSCGCITSSRVNPLYVSCDANPTDAEPGTQISFTATPTGGSGTYSSYSWQFGNGVTTTSYINNIKYSYYLTGTYNSQVTVTDNKGQKATAQCPAINIQNAPPITLTCNAFPTSGTAPLDVNFDAQASGGSGMFTNYKWTFGDGQTTNTQSENAQHTYINQGSYSSQITVTDSKGRMKTVSCPSIKVNPIAIPLQATCTVYPTSGVVPLYTYFTATATGGSGGYNYNWNFDDGYSQTTLSKYISHTYTLTGMFNPQLTVTDNSGNSVTTSCPQISVTPKINPITITCNANPTTGTAPLDVNYNAQTNGGTGTYTNYKWTFGDGQYENTYDQNEMHTFTNQGTYTTQVTVTDSAGSTKTASCPTIRVNPTPLPLQATCAAYPTSGVVPLYSSFTATATGGSGGYNYNWNFDDGYSQTTLSKYISHTYTLTGMFNPQLTVTDNSGNSVTTSCPQISVTPKINPITITCNANPTTGTAPLDVNYNAQTNGGTGTYTNYKWTFGDGQYENTYDQNEMHTFTNQGTYTTQVTVTDSAGSTKTASCPTIRVNPTPLPLQATCTVYPTSGTVPLYTYFTATATGGSGGYNYNWNFDDGYSQTTLSKYISHTYTLTGMFNPQLTVTDNSGNSVVATCPQISVTPKANPLTVTCTAYPTSGTAPLDVNYNAQANGGSGMFTNYLWTFGDGQLDNTYDSNEMHTFTNQGTFYGRVMVTDSQGKTATGYCPMIKVNPAVEPLTATCSANPRNGTAPLNTYFTSIAHGGSSGYKYQWYFTDGMTQNTYSGSTSHVYNIMGYYSPYVIVTDSQGNTVTADCGNVNVVPCAPPLQISCDASPKDGTAPLDVYYNADPTGGSGTYTNFYWTFGDGSNTNSYMSSIDHTFNNAGFFYGSVRVTDSNGKTASATCPTIKVTAAPKPIVVSCTASPRTGFAPLNTYFSSTASGGNGIYTYQWTFGDGTMQSTSLRNTNHLYAYEGDYYPMLVVTDSQGNTGSADCGSIMVNSRPQMYVTCDVDQTNAEPGTQISFTATPTGGSGTYSVYSWQFGNGVTTNSYINNIKYTYYLTGTYNSQVTVTDNAGQKATAQCPAINIQNAPPITLTCNANPTSGNIPLNVNFDAMANGGSGMFTNYRWTFGDGQTTNTQSEDTQHTYMNQGTYSSQVTVTDSKGKMKTVSCPTIQAIKFVEPLSATCNINPTDGIVPLSVYFYGSATGGSGVYNYRWTFGDGSSTSTSSGSTSHVYNQANGYDPFLIVSDNQGKSVTVQCGHLTVRPCQSPLTVSCTANPKTGIVPLNVAFTAYANGGAGDYTYSWNFDDGVVLDDGSSISHTYINTGTFFPKIVVTDNDGHTASAYCPSTGISVKPPVSNLVANAGGPYNGFVYESVNFDGSRSSGNIVKYSWQFGDGTTLESTSPYMSYIYTRIGVFTVRLTVYDSYGNSDSATSTVTVIEHTAAATVPTEAKAEGGLIVQSISIYGKYSDILRTNDDMTVTVNSLNDFTSSIRDAHLTVEIPELGLTQQSDSSNIGRGDSESFTAVIPFENVLPGVYFAKIIVGNDEIKKIKYRDVVVKDSNACGIICPAV